MRGRIRRVEGRESRQEIPRYPRPRQPATSSPSFLSPSPLPLFLFLSPLMSGSYYSCHTAEARPWEGSCRIGVNGKSRVRRWLCVGWVAVPARGWLLDIDLSGYNDTVQRAAIRAGRRYISLGLQMSVTLRKLKSFDSPFYETRRGEPLSLVRIQNEANFNFVTL